MLFFMKKILLITTELFPYTRGGLGSYVHNAAIILSKEFEVHILIPDISFRHKIDFRKNNKKNVKIFTFDDLSFNKHKININIPHLHESVNFSLAVNELVKKNDYALIEFYDFTGPAFITLNLKNKFGYFKDIPIVIHNHTVLKMIDSFENNKPSGSIYDYIYFSEIFCLENADAVFYSGKKQAIFDQNFNSYRPNDFVITGMPFYLSGRGESRRNYAGNDILFLGKVQKIKGIDNLLKASNILLQKGILHNIHIIGKDLPYPLNTSIKYSDYLLKNVSREEKEHYIFYDHLNHEQIDEIIKKCKFAVVPSILESFGYVAHELYSKKMPLILNKLPTFEDYFTNGKNCIFYDGSTIDLVEKINNFLCLNNNEIKKFVKEDIEYINFLEVYKLYIEKNYTNKKNIINRNITKDIFSIVDDLNKKIECIGILHDKKDFIYYIKIFMKILKRDGITEVFKRVIEKINL